MGDGSEPDQGFFGKMKSAGKRAITGESLFMTHFTNGGGGVQQVAFAAPYPGKIVPVDLATLGGRIVCQKDAFLCAAMAPRLASPLTASSEQDSFHPNSTPLTTLSAH
jgi:uncharacterized protein (AIM24 family)